MTQCKANTGAGHQCSRAAVDRGWCKQHAVPIFYVLLRELEENIGDWPHCPCEWGDTASPMIGDNGRKLIVCCGHCERSTGELTLKSAADFPLIQAAWEEAVRT